MDDPIRNSSLKLEDLEEKLRRAEEELKTLHVQRDAAQGETQKLRAALKERGETLKWLEAQLLKLQTEREQVRSRIKQLIARIDSLNDAVP